MMWFKREPKAVSEKSVENGVVGKLRKKKPVTLQPTRESSERETSTESDKERRRYSDILDITVSQERRDESDESLYESADGHSDAISASDDALSRLKTPAISKESLKLAVTDEEVETRKKGHRKALSLSNPLEIVKTLGDEWFDATRHDRNFDKKKSRESLWSEEDRDSIHGSSMKLDQIRKDSKKDKNLPSRKTSTTEPPKTRKSSKRSSVGALSFLRRKKTPTSTAPIEAVAEDGGKVLTIEEILNYTKLFLDFEKRHSSECESRPPAESDSDDEPPTPKQIAEHRRRLSRQTSRSKSKARGKSQSLKVNTLRKSHSGTLKKGKKKSVKTPSGGRSRQASIVEQTPILVKKNSDTLKQNSWLFSGSKGESRREGSTDDQGLPDADVDTSDANARDTDSKDTNWRIATSGGRGVNRAESCRERDAPRRGKHRNASDPNRLTAHNNHDLEPGAPTAPSGSSSSSSLSSRSNESGTVATEQQASQSDWSEEDEPLAVQWADSLPPQVLDSLVLSARLRKRQEVIHELIVSEGSHVRWLKVLGGVFLRPLESQPTLLPAEELRALFPNLPGVRERHSRLYADLRALRNDSNDPIVQIRPVADAMLNTLGDSGYAACLSKFCRGQRMALEALRERRRKNKELHQFLSSREQLPLCGRLQLRDLLACVWQRLTKYQLLLEGVVKTVCDSDCESEEDVARVRRALSVAKDVLHRVDTAIRTAENEHRLRTIQSKLEIRVPSGSDWDELRRLDLTQHQLRMEGDLSIRNDSKKINVLALMLEDSLVLVQREGDKFVLKPISQSSSSQHQQLSPLIKWDKVLFRPNAAVRNTFFLMNINGVQMHELSANTAPEYATWVKYIQESPLAKLTELKPTITASHQASRSADDSGINVSRNPSDASEKSSSTVPLEEQEMERDRASLERSSTEREKEEKVERDREEKVERARETNSTEREREEKKSSEERRSIDKDEVSEREEKHKPRRPTVGRISTHGAEPAAVLEPSAALHVHEPAAVLASTAVRAYTHGERLRRLDEVIRNGLAAKSNVVGEILGVPKHCYAEVAEMAVAEALGQVDVGREMRTIRGHLTRSDSIEEQSPPLMATNSIPGGVTSRPDLHHLLLAAQTQVNQLTRSISLAISVNETAAVSARASRGRCDHCRPKIDHQPAPVATVTTGIASVAAAAGAATGIPTQPVLGMVESNSIHIDLDKSAQSETNLGNDTSRSTDPCLERDISYDMLAELDSHENALEGALDDDLDWSISGAELAKRLSGTVCGLQRTLSALLAAVPMQRDEAALRAEVAALRDGNDALRARLKHENQTTDDGSSYSKGAIETPGLEDQPTNGG